MSPQRRVSFAGSSVAIEYDDPPCAEIGEFLFRDVPQLDASPPSTDIYRMECLEPGRFSLSRAREILYAGASSGAMAEILMSDVCHTLAAESLGGMLFHAAALSWHGRGVLVPGSMGAGKSTFAAWMLIQGCDYLTDELVYIPHGSLEIQAFPRPLHLKHSARAVLPTYAGRSDILSSPFSDLVPAYLFNPTTHFTRAEVRLILFLHYQPASEPIFQNLTRAQTGLALMQCLINARNLPESGFPEAVRLARSASACKLTYSAFGQVQANILKALENLDR